MDAHQPPAVPRTPGLPDWFQVLGRGAWLVVVLAIAVVPGARLPVALRTVGLLRDTGLFAQGPPASGRSKAMA